MNYKRDPIYRALSSDKPDKEKTLAAALSAMDGAPKAKTRIAPTAKIRWAVSACLVILAVALVPAIIFGTDIFASEGGMLPRDNGNSYMEDAPAAPQQDGRFGFDLDSTSGEGKTDSAIISAPPPSSYKEYNGTFEERVYVYVSSEEPPAAATSVYIEKLGVWGLYTLQPADNNMYLIRLYFDYGGTGYLVCIYCTGEDRLDYFLEKITI